MFKQISILVVVALIFFSLGFYIGTKDERIASVINNNNQLDTFQAGWEAAKDRLAETGFTPFIETEEITSVDGEVINIENNKIELKIRPLGPLSDPDLDQRIVRISQDTKIYQLEEKDSEEYEKEMNQFNKRMQEQMDNPELAEPLDPPDFFLKKEADIDSIRIGDQLTAIAKENIKEIKEFEAIEIIVQPTMGQ
ncbi:MAG: hypothetical protein U9Q16_02405 [Patescibacteria group bacterium]|nr:hypothetical protein [Patescibacteria group bacterium]